MPSSLQLQVPWPPLTLLAVLAPLPLAALLMFSFASTRRWQPAGKHVLITGGSSGLGLALAELLASRGASVTLVARDQQRLDRAQERVQAACSTPQQFVQAISADLISFEGCRTALARATEQAAARAPSAASTDAAAPAGRVPDAIFCCAGAARPGWFIEQTEQMFREGMDTDYFTALGMSHAAAQAYSKSGQTGGKIVLVSSTLGFMGLVGYSQYSPTKHAIKGLADCLRSELQLYGISVHAYFPGTILSPGYERENETKPKITLQIEGDGEKAGLSPAVCAKGLLRGLERNQYFITTDFESELFRASALGSGPGNGWLMDRLKGAIGAIGIPLWRIFEADPLIKKHRAEHYRELGLNGGVAPR